MISIASDHGGYRLKEHIKAYLTAKGLSVLDCGCDSEESCDYPVFGKAGIFYHSFGVGTSDRKHNLVRLQNWGMNHHGLFVQGHAIEEPFTCVGLFRKAKVGVDASG